MASTTRPKVKAIPTLGYGSARNLINDNGARAREDEGKCAGYLGDIFVNGPLSAGWRSSRRDRDRLIQIFAAEIWQAPSKHNQLIGARLHWDCRRRAARELQHSLA